MQARMQNSDAHNGALPASTSLQHATAQLRDSKSNPKFRQQSAEACMQWLGSTTTGSVQSIPEMMGEAISPLSEFQKCVMRLVTSYAVEALSKSATTFGHSKAGADRTPFFARNSAWKLIHQSIKLIGPSHLWSLAESSLLMLLKPAAAAMQFWSKSSDSVFEDGDFLPNVACIVEVFEALFERLPSQYSPDVQSSLQVFSASSSLFARAAGTGIAKRASKPGDFLQSAIKGILVSCAMLNTVFSRSQLFKRNYSLFCEEGLPSCSCALAVLSVNEVLSEVTIESTAAESSGHPMAMVRAAIIGCIRDCLFPAASLEPFAASFSSYDIIGYVSSSISRPSIDGDGISVVQPPKKKRSRPNPVKSQAGEQAALSEPPFFASLFKSLCSLYSKDCSGCCEVIRSVFIAFVSSMKAGGQTVRCNKRTVDIVMAEALLAIPKHSTSAQNHENAASVCAGILSCAALQDLYQADPPSSVEAYAACAEACIQLFDEGGSCALTCSDNHSLVLSAVCQLDPALALKHLQWCFGQGLSMTLTTEISQAEAVSNRQQSNENTLDMLLTSASRSRKSREAISALMLVQGKHPLLAWNPRNNVCLSVTAKFIRKSGSAFDGMVEQIVQIAQEVSKLGSAVFAAQLLYVLGLFVADANDMKQANTLVSFLPQIIRRVFNSIPAASWKLLKQKGSMDDKSMILFSMCTLLDVVNASLLLRKQFNQEDLNDLDSQAKIPILIVKNLAEEHNLPSLAQEATRWVGAPESIDGYAACCMMHWCGLDLTLSEVQSLVTVGQVQTDAEDVASDTITSAVESAECFVSLFTGLINGNGDIPAGESKRKADRSQDFQFDGGSHVLCAIDALDLYLNVVGLLAPSKSLVQLWKSVLQEASARFGQKSQGDCSPEKSARKFALHSVLSESSVCEIPKLRQSLEPASASLVASIKSSKKFGAVVRAILSFGEDVVAKAVLDHLSTPLLAAILGKKIVAQDGSQQTLFEFAKYNAPVSDSLELLQELSARNCLSWSVDLGPQILVDLASCCDSGNCLDVFERLLSTIAMHFQPSVSLNDAVCSLIKHVASRMDKGKGRKYFGVATILLKGIAAHAVSLMGESAGTVPHDTRLTKRLAMKLIESSEKAVAATCESDDPLAQNSIRVLLLLFESVLSARKNLQLPISVKEGSPILRAWPSLVTACNASTSASSVNGDVDAIEMAGIAGVLFRLDRILDGLHGCSITNVFRPAIVAMAINALQSSIGKCYTGMVTTLDVEEQLKTCIPCLSRPTAILLMQSASESIQLSANTAQETLVGAKVVQLLAKMLPSQLLPITVLNSGSRKCILSMCVAIKSPSVDVATKASIMEDIAVLVSNLQGKSGIQAICALSVSSALHCLGAILDTFAAKPWSRQARDGPVFTTSNKGFDSLHRAGSIHSWCSQIVQASTRILLSLLKDDQVAKDNMHVLGNLHAMCLRSLCVCSSGATGRSGEFEVGDLVWPACKLWCKCSGMFGSSSIKKASKSFVGSVLQEWLRQAVSPFALTGTRERALKPGIFEILSIMDPKHVQAQLLEATPACKVVLKSLLQEFKDL